jgi:CBS domain-containing protein
VLLPVAREGLLSHGLAERDADEYLGVIRDRVARGVTGAQWMLDSLKHMGSDSMPIERSRALARAIHDRQWTGGPIHTWTPAEATEAKDWRHGYQRIEQFMTTDLFTVQPDDLLDLAANVMDWKHIRHVPVEDGGGRLVGVLSHRTLMRVLAQRAGGVNKSVAVRDVMKKNPVTVEKHTSTLDAIGVMRRNRVGCLPVVDEGVLVGIVTEHDLLNIAARLFEDQLREFGTA